ncbi:MAG TPA: DUF3820 family protein [Salinimicrobium sp.]|nr:DUF3820 family protein [Salinimicrobium sp.]
MSFLNAFLEIADMEIQPEKEYLIELAHAKMHFGKYKGDFLSEIPEHYLVWFKQQGFPKGKLGEQLQQVFELKLNGMEHILRTIRNKYPRKTDR